MTTLGLAGELTPQPFAETGRPAGGFQFADGAVTALCTDFLPLYWPGRATYRGHRLRHRVSLYSQDLGTLIGLFDEARFPVNDIAFHPTQPIIAIATGDYDGGYLFEGDLWLWNWESGETRSLLAESRDVVHCRFLDADRLAVAMHPRFEDEFASSEGWDDDAGDAAFTTFVGLIIDDFRDASHGEHTLPRGRGDQRLVDLLPSDPESLGFTDLPLQFNDRHQHFNTALGDAANYEERARAWDVQWVADNQIALVHDNCHVEVWDVDGERQIHAVGEGFGVQILVGPAGPLVHVIRRGDYFNRIEDQSALYRLTAVGLAKVCDFDRPMVMSTDADGNLLCRDVGSPRKGRVRKDRLLTCEQAEVFAGDLGHYDCFNHYLRLDGGNGLYLLQGTATVVTRAEATVPREPRRFSDACTGLGRSRVTPDGRAGMLGPGRFAAPLVLCLRSPGPRCDQGPAM